MHYISLLVLCTAALNYGLFRQASFNTTPQYIMFYDIGALSTTAAIIGVYICACFVCMPVSTIPVILNYLYGGFSEVVKVVVFCVRVSHGSGEGRKCGQYISTTSSERNWL